MRIALLTLIFGFVFVLGTFDAKAQSRPQFFPNAGYCPEGTHPRGAYGGTNDQVPDVTRDCAPDKPAPKKKN